MFQSTQPARGLCDNLPLTGISCSLNRCHADLPPSCCSFAMDSFRTTPGPADFGTQISPDLQLRILQECFETGQHLWRQDRNPLWVPGHRNFSPKNIKHQFRPPLRPSRDPELGPPGLRGFFGNQNSWISWIFMSKTSIQIGLIGSEEAKKRRYKEGTKKGFWCEQIKK